MTRKSRQTDEGPADDAAADEAGAAPNALDLWLKRELAAMDSGTTEAALPPRLADLAARLEQRLRQRSDEEAG